jgi:hypothetical protein
LRHARHLLSFAVMGADVGRGAPAKRRQPTHQPPEKPN